MSKKLRLEDCDSSWMRKRAKFPKLKPKVRFVRRTEWVGKEVYYDSGEWVLFWLFMSLPIVNTIISFVMIVTYFFDGRREWFEEEDE